MSSRVSTSRISAVGVDETPDLCGAEYSGTEIMRIEKKLRTSADKNLFIRPPVLAAGAAPVSLVGIGNQAQLTQYGQICQLLIA